MLHKRYENNCLFLKAIHPMDVVDALDSLDQTAQMLEVAHVQHDRSFKDPVIRFDGNRPDIRLEIA